MSDQSPITVNGRKYTWPDQPLVVVCIDGSEPDYIEQAVAAGAMPYMAKMLERGSDLRAHCVVPSFTNPNNISIVTGMPPAVHGISGNFFYDREADAEVMMNDAALLRCPTLFQEFESKGARIAVITAKDKLRSLLGHGLRFGASGSICFSSEKADQANIEGNGIENVLDRVSLPLPSVYSADLSEFVFAAGVKIMENERPDIMYLSTTDYIQHKHAPGSTGANDFYQMMDGYWAQLDALGATIALTADHGMNAKHDDMGKPNVIYMQDLLDDWFTQGSARVILPITDPYVVHHGALGSYATAYLPEDMDIPKLLERLNAMDGIESAMDRATACERFGLPEDRVGDIVVVSTKHVVLGTSESRHDLSGLEVPLRSHGGVSEQSVPLIVNRKVSGLDANRVLRNFDIFDVALNHVAAVEQRKAS